MNEIAKFTSDIEKILKHDRQNNGGKSDYSRVKRDLQNLFEKTASCGELSSSIYEYWENEYIYKSENTAAEPSVSSIEKLSAFLGFLDTSREGEELINQNDWNEIGRFVDYEAEDMEIDLLQELMKILVDHGAY